MGSNARERHGLYRCGAFVAARVRRPSILNIREVVNILHAESLESFKHQTARSTRHRGQAKRIVECCTNLTGVGKWWASLWAIRRNSGYEYPVKKA